MIFTLVLLRFLLRFDALKQSVSTTAAMLVQEEPCRKCFPPPGSWPDCVMSLVIDFGLKQVSSGQGEGKGEELQSDWWLSRCNQGPYETHMCRGVGHLSPHLDKLHGCDIPQKTAGTLAG